MFENEKQKNSQLLQKAIDKKGKVPCAALKRPSFSHALKFKITKTEQERS